MIPQMAKTTPLPCLLLLLLCCHSASAQLLDSSAEESGIDPERVGEKVTVQFRVGAEITAVRGACKDIRAMVAVPFECAEQSVRLVSEDFSRHVDKVKVRDLDGGAQQMLITIPYLGAGETATAIQTYEVTTNTIEPPEDEDTVDLVIPKRPDRKVRKYLTSSPMIESRDGKIRSLAGELWRETDDLSTEDGEVTDWRRIEHLYDYMLENIKYSEGPDKSAANTLRDGKADCFGRSALFIALCRANDIPARVVWVDQHCYAEFYMEDAEGTGQWFPIESAGSRSFGGMPLARTIMQKGDSFQVPERRGEKLFYASDYLMALPVGKSGKPTVKYIREEVPQ
ncbi:transglutaminase-like domain-containing protein [Aeoliella mucimassa]|uniref:Transglutaminase-like superfamily protein n=1 Tax=Aeoliella mucimassa TaxID=2527972 RepID=A0A518AVB6_9BACT|nr:transglutaminase-like domain-containing protein [Aeoliella mucimassa]QDU58656.1 Transglutaminase-like superfamily protein [Aeoliella mucimassa]